MKRNRRILFLAAGILSCAFPLLWASVELAPPVGKVAWLLLGCVIGLGTPLTPLELLLLAGLLTPGLFTALAAHADLNTLQSYVSVCRVMLTLGLYAALTGFSVFIKNPAGRFLMRLCLILVVPLLFALGLDRSSVLLSFSLAALAWVLLLFIRGLRIRA